MQKKYFTFCLYALCLWLVGCYATDRAEYQSALIPSYNPSNVFALSDEIQQNINRVALLPIYNNYYARNILEPLDRSFNMELGQMQLFEVVTVSENDLKELFGASQFDSTQRLPHDFFSKIKAYYNADAVMFVDLTSYKPYKPMVMGIRAKLVSTENVTILWSFESIYDAGDTRVAMGARRYQRQFDTQSYPLNSPVSVLQSPRKFSKYVAYTTFRTLKKNS